MRARQRCVSGLFWSLRFVFHTSACGYRIYAVDVVGLFVVAAFIRGLINSVAYFFIRGECAKECCFDLEVGAELSLAAWYGFLDVQNVDFAPLRQTECVDTSVLVSYGDGSFPCLRMGLRLKFRSMFDICVGA